MDINSWLNNRGSYEQGVFLYNQLPHPNPNLLRLFNRGKNKRAYSRLRYELNKHRGTAVKQAAPQPIVVKPKSPVAEISKEVLKQGALERENKKVIPAQLPPNLRKVYYQKNQDFYQLYELKLQLNALPHDAEDKALELIKQMMVLRRAVSAAWEQIDYWVAHKREKPTTGFNVDELTPMQLVQARQRRYAQRTKRNATLKKWQKELEATNGKHPRMAAKIAKQQDHLEQLEQEIKLLTNKINGAT